MEKKFQYQKVAEEYLQKYPEVASKTLARKIEQDHPKLMHTIEQWRGIIRQLRGARGRKNREKRKNLTTYDNTKKIDPNRLPTSHIEQREHYVLAKESNRVLIISDLHIPYHEPKALTAALNHGLENGANCVLINGDLIDFHKISRFQADPRKRDVVEEFKATRQFLEYLRELFPKAEIVWSEGNHDARYPNFLAAHALPLFNDPYYHLEQRLGLDELNIKFVHQNRLVMAGKLSISHGHMITRGIFAPVNPARGVFLRTKASHLVGHSHQVSEHTEPTIYGDLITTWSTGCLCELRPDYDPHVSKGAHGFAFMTIDDDGHFRVKNYRIFNGVVL